MSYEEGSKEFEQANADRAVDRLHPNKRGREDCFGCCYPERHCSECLSRARNIRDGE